MSNGIRPEDVKKPTTALARASVDTNLIAGASRLIGLDLKDLGPKARTMLDTLIRTVGDSPSPGVLGGAAKRLATAALLDLVDRFVPPAFAAPQNKELGELKAQVPITAPVPGEKGVHQLALPPGHLVSSLLQELGIPAHKLPPRVAAALDDARNDRKLQALTNEGVWTQFARKILGAAVEDGLTELVPKLVAGASAPAAAATTVVVGPQGKAKVVEQDAGGKAQVSEQLAQSLRGSSSTQRRTSAGTNPMATLLMNRVGKADAAEAKRVPEQLAHELAKHFGVPVTDPRVAAVQKSIERCLVFNAEGVLDTAASLEAACRTLAKQDSRSAFRTLLSSAELIKTTFEERGRPVENLSPSMAQSLAKFTAYALTQHAANVFGKSCSLSDEKNSAALERMALSLEVEGKKHAINKMFDRRTAQAEEPAAAKASQGGEPLFFTKDPALAKAFAALSSGDPKQAAARMAKAFAELMPKEVPFAVDLSKIAAVYEQVLSRGMGSGFEVAMNALGFYAEHAGLPDDRFQDLAKQAGELGALVKSGESALELLDRELASIPEKKAKLEERLQGLEGELAQHQQAGLKDSAATTQKEIDLARSELSKLGEDEKILGGKRTEHQAQLAEDRNVLAQAGANFLLGCAFYACDPEGEKARNAGGAGNNKPPPGGGGDDPPFRGVGDGGGSPAGRGSLARRRYEACAEVLADPSLSVQDKVFLFMMIFVSFMDMEREDKLREVIKQDEAQAVREEQRDALRKERAGDEKMVSDLSSQVEQAKKELAELKAQVPPVPPNDPRMKAAEDKVGNRTRAYNVANEKCQKKAEDYDRLMRETEQAPRSREVIFMELERLDQIRSQIFNMARNLIEESNKLIERIFR